MKDASKYTLSILLTILLLAMPLAIQAENSVMDRLRASSFVFAGTDCSDKKESMLQAADHMLSAGYEPAFVAGLLGNIAREADFGRFENIFGYSESRIRAVFANKIAAGGHIYVAHMQGLASLDSCGHSHEEYRLFNNKHIYDGISLSLVSAVLSTYQAEGWKALFGLGAIQWSMERTVALMSFYRQAAGMSDTISYDQTVTAELNMMAYELQGSYQYIYNNWKSANAGILYSEAAARDAGDRICRYYEGLTSDISRSERSAIAAAIYQVMSEADMPAMSPTVTPTQQPEASPVVPTVAPLTGTPLPVSTPVPTVTPMPEEFHLNTAAVSLSLHQEQTYQLTWESTTGLSGVPAYTSTDTSVATVTSAGKISAKAVGSAVIVAVSPGGTVQTCAVTVTGPKASFAKLRSESKRAMTIKAKCKEKIISWELKYRKNGTSQWQRKTYKTASVRLTGLKSKQTYEFCLRIRFRADNGKKYDTAWSTVKKAKVK